VGESIRIFLKDGTPTGVRHAELVNWTGQAIACPRNRFSELDQWPETKRPGVYFLFGERDGEPLAYVGEAEHVLDRLAEHLKEKDFWKDAVIFTSKDENLTKSHIKYLESKLIEMARDAGRFPLDNIQTPSSPMLPRGDIDCMDTFLKHLKTLLGVLGHLILQEPVSQRNSETVANDELSPSAAQWDREFELTTKNLSAKSIMTNEGMVVLKGSQAIEKHLPSLSSGYIRKREELIADKVLVPEGNKLVFSKDFLFSSPSAASSVIIGNNSSGPQYWATEGGITLKEFESSLATTLVSNEDTPA